VVAEFFVIAFIAVFIMLAAPDRKINFWCGISILTLSGGSLTYLLWVHMIPYVLTHYPEHTILLHFLKYFHIFLSIFTYTQGPICFCVFFLTCAGCLEDRSRMKILKIFIVMNIPNIIINIIFSPLDFQHNLETSSAMWAMYHWVYIPVLICIFRYLKALKNKKEYYIWSERFLGLLMILISLYDLFIFYTCRMLLLTNVYLYLQPYVTWLFAVLFLIVLGWQGAAGIKINLERNDLDSHIQVANSSMLFIAHAFKGEISKIQSCSQLIEGRLSDRESKEYGKIIDRSCDTLQIMLERTKTQLQDITIQYEPVDLSELVMRVISDYEAMALIRGIKIRHKIPKGIHVISDRDHIYNVVDNLLKNAIEALPKADGYIFITLEVLAKELVLSVRDNGCGMDPEQLKQIRQPFFTTKHTGENYGLGMTYCHRVIKKLNGRIEIKSKPGEGSVIWIFLKR